MFTQIAIECTDVVLFEYHFLPFTLHKNDCKVVSNRDSLERGDRSIGVNKKHYLMKIADSV
jgi:hypothetical protein